MKIRECAGNRKHAEIAMQVSPLIFFRQIAQMLNTIMWCFSEATWLTPTWFELRCVKPIQNVNIFLSPPFASVPVFYYCPLMSLSRFDALKRRWINLMKIKNTLKCTCIRSIFLNFKNIERLFMTYIDLYSKTDLQKFRYAINFYYI